MLAMETLNVNLNTSPLIFIEFFNRVFSLQINSEFADQTLGLLSMEVKIFPSWS